uniref:MI domain-containing protein n=1 Tax=Globisporangium ultimum (strain ATCC 200006 / CBS 805.95 / DAOM BR144) TaxID=431595 RepID=K3WQU0_GLOUD
MTESRLENRALPIPNGDGSSSGPVTTMMTTTTTTTTTTKTTKLNPSAKSFVFNTAAPAWTPSYAVPSTPVVAAPLAPASPALKPAAIPAVASPAPKLKAEAKPFVPSFLAKPFVPSFAVAAPVVAAPAESEPVVEKAQSEASVEPESEDIKEPAPSAVVATENESPVKEADVVVVKTEQVIVTEEVQVVEEQTTTVITEESSTVAETQAVIGERIIYTIAQLLEMEPENCPVPASVVGLPVAAETTGKASKTFSNDSPSKSGRGGGGRRGESSRSLHRSNSSYSEGGRGGRRGGRGGRGHNPHDTAPAAEDCAPLDINEETRWKPSHSKSRLDAPEDTTEASLKEAKSILNKLSIEKFEKLSNELIAVAVRNIDVLTGVIETIILKAKMEWHFSTMYAELCTKMSRTQMPAVTIDGEVVEDTNKLFRRLLLKRCEQEFLEAPSREGFELLSEEDLAEKELIIKRGVLGHIRFVGELFKLRMIKSRIMHQCVANLFGDTENPDEESLECLTKLLTTIGQVFELNVSGEAELAAIVQYYAVIKALSKDSARLSTRIRFMLQDLLDLRKNNWVARRKEAKAMTIAEVHAEAKREADEKAKASASGGGGGNARLQRSQSMNLGSDKRRNNGPREGASDAWKARAAATAGGSVSSSSSSVPTVDADGWETVASSKPKLTKTRSNSDRFPASSSSSSGAPRPPKGNSSRGAQKSDSNASSRGGRKDRERSASSSSSGFGALRRGSSMSDLGRPPMSQPLSKSKSTSSSNSSANSDSESATSKSKTQEPLSAAAFEKKVKSILEEYVEMRDIEEATQCFMELASDEHHALIATQSLNIGLEKGNKERAAISSFLAGLHERKVLSTDAIATPLHELLEFAEDMEIDIPLTLQYIAEMIAPSVASGAVPLPRLVASVEHLAYNGKAAKVVGKTLVAVGDSGKAKELVDAAALDFLPLLAEAHRHDDGLQAFYQDNQLDFLLA